MLGPSILFFCPTFSTFYALYALHACRRANAKVAACIGLALAVVELLGLVCLVTIQVYYVMM